MTKLEAIERKAQQEANRSNKPMAVLNLNPFGGLFVIREWDDRYLGHRDLVTRICPDHGG